jgi:hypothetical protein
MAKLGFMETQWLQGIFVLLLAQPGIGSKIPFACHPHCGPSVEAFAEEYSGG